MLAPLKNKIMNITGKLKRDGKIIVLQLFNDGIYTNTVYSRKVYELKQYARDNNIKIVLDNSHTLLK